MPSIDGLQMIPTESVEVGLNRCHYYVTCCGTDDSLCDVSGCDNSYGCKESGTGCGQSCEDTCGYTGL